MVESIGRAAKSSETGINKKMEGKTFMNFEVAYSNFAGNCTLIIKTDYEAEPQKIKNFFLYFALNQL